MGTVLLRDLYLTKQKLRGWEANWGAINHPSKNHPSECTLGGHMRGGKITNFLRLSAMYSWTIILSRVLGRYLSTHSIFAALNQRGRRGSEKKGRSGGKGWTEWQLPSSTHTYMHSSLRLPIVFATPFLWRNYATAPKRWELGAIYSSNLHSTSDHTRIREILEALIDDDV